MKRDRRCGFSLIELLVAIALAGVLMTALASLLIDAARINRSQQLTAEVQANARNTLAVIVQALRSAGWDPLPAGIATVGLDPDPADGIDQLEIFADLDADGLTDKDREQLLIRHVGDRIEWRPQAGGPFVVLAVNVSNDVDENGIPEPLFTPVPNPDPTTIRVQITARSPIRDPVSGRFILHTVASDVALRNSLGAS